MYVFALCVFSNVYTCMQVFRHGDRSPVYAFPKEWCDECYWPQGLGQLSIVSV